MVASLNTLTARSAQHRLLAIPAPIRAAYTGSISRTAAAEVDLSTLGGVLTDGVRVIEVATLDFGASTHVVLDDDITVLRCAERCTLAGRIDGLDANSGVSGPISSANGTRRGAPSPEATDGLTPYLLSGQLADIRTPSAGRPAYAFSGDYSAASIRSGRPGKTLIIESRLIEIESTADLRFTGEQGTRRQTDTGGSNNRYAISSGGQGGFILLHGDVLTLPNTGSQFDGAGGAERNSDNVTGGAGPDGLLLAVYHRRLSGDLAARSSNFTTAVLRAARWPRRLR